MIKDNFLLEDTPDVMDDLEIIHKSFMNVLKGCTEGNFTNIQNDKDKLDSAIKHIELLNAKKLQRDEQEGMYRRQVLGEWVNANHGRFY